MPHIRTALILIVFFLTTACTAQIDVSRPELPSPLIEPLPVSVGVYYSPEFESYPVKERVHGSGGFFWETNLGPSSVALFDSVLDSVFESVVRVSSRIPDAETDASVTAIIEPTITYVTHVRSNVVNHARVTYQVTFWHGHIQGKIEERISQCHTSANKVMNNPAN